MNASQRAAALALVLAWGLSACSSGGGAAPAPPRATAAPLGHATGTLTIRYPTVQTLKASGSSRSPRFVDPNGSSITFDDAGAGDVSTTIAVAPGPGGTQTATVPLIAGDSVLTIHEHDGLGNALAGGAVVLTGTPAGSTQTLTVTLNMIVVGVAVTTDPVSGSDVTTLSQTSGIPTDWAQSLNGCSAVLGRSYLIPYDAANSYQVPLNAGVGLGGIPQVQITLQVADNNGTTRLITDTTGALRVAFDAQHNGVTAVVQVFDSSNNLQTTAYIRYTYRFC
ncbi:MAG: hypothetical protein JWN27_1450 [Candidatus Eremiobacteraeota bacterium]|nr:hypothetical protein [Candidatus Eremiobacteraeota bacterium]